MIAIMDYEIGNVRSVQKALERAAAEVARQDGIPRQEVVLTADPAIIAAADGLVLPGVGAFGQCITNFRQAGFEPLVRDAIAQGKPLLGICVGMQMLFDVSEEMGEWPGLGILPGRVRRFDPGPQGLRIPQIGWNQLHHDGSNPLLRGIPDGAYAYFVHSYYCDAADPNDVIATTDYGIEYPSVVGRGWVWGIQCHPEKSHDVGLAILRNFVRIVCER
ncbi:MAG TPA: imidazole glycerol phosphate synthase subunit HisH [Caldilineae bacterium]|nr:imidazole glycerol phosphate synthase subunit HisH [Caldilineae bacterium]